MKEEDKKTILEACIPAILSGLVLGLVCGIIIFMTGWFYINLINMILCLAVFFIFVFFISLIFNRGGFWFDDGLKFGTFLFTSFFCSLLVTAFTFSFILNLMNLIFSEKDFILVHFVLSTCSLFVILFFSYMKRQEFKHYFRNSDLRKLIKMVYWWIFPSVRTKYLIKELKGCKSVLDLGCGRCSILDNTPKINQYRVGVELFKPYIKENLKRKPQLHDKYIYDDITKIKFKTKSFDAVICMDVIEHLDRQNGLKLIEKMEKWAKKKVIIYTTNDFVAQNGYGGNELQRHLSGWSTNDFRKRGYHVRGIHGLKYLRSMKAEIRFTPYLFWRVVVDLTQKITYYIPALAFQLFSVKEINQNEIKKTTPEIKE